jgi:hypothetical protein
MATRIQAAMDTANDTSANSSCGAISQSTTPPDGANYGINDGFYWEIGDENGIITDSASGLRAAGSVQPAGSSSTYYDRNSLLAVASASKWLYGSYVAETKANTSNWTFPAAYIPFLNFTSGYENMSDDSCSSAATVGDCLSTPNGLGISGAPDNGSQTAGDAGKFFYNSGHLEVFEGSDPAIFNSPPFTNGGSKTDDELASDVQTALANHGVNMSLMYASPNLAGGVVTTPADYAAFLQGLIRTNNPLNMRHFLKPTASDSYAVCTNPQTCASAVSSPLDHLQSWHYSITHWIEDDPTTGDGSYSSPGKFGFYPWVDSTFTYYGIVAREDPSDAAIGQPQTAPFYMSDQCGAAIRTAFMLGVKQP